MVLAGGLPPGRLEPVGVEAEAGVLVVAAAEDAGLDPPQGDAPGPGRGLRDGRVVLAAVAHLPEADREGEGARRVGPRPGDPARGGDQVVGHVVLGALAVLEGGLRGQAEAAHQLAGADLEARLQRPAARLAVVAVAALLRLDLLALRAVRVVDGDLAGGLVGAGLGPGGGQRPGLDVPAAGHVLAEEGHVAAGRADAEGPAGLPAGLRGAREMLGEPGATGDDVELEGAGQLDAGDPVDMHVVGASARGGREGGREPEGAGESQNEASSVHQRRVMIAIRMSVPPAGYAAAMSIGVSLFLIATGAILRYAVTWNPEGVNIETVGLILLLVGIAGLIISLG